MAAAPQFPIRSVDRSRAQAVEPLGSKPKFWFSEARKRLLFKADDRGTGEDWAEVIACHLCAELGVPHVDYELAAECDGAQYIRPGVVCENMASAADSLVLGNELLLARDPQYPRDQRFKVRQHTVASVADAVALLEPPAEKWISSRTPAKIQSALDVFAGYLMLDAWIANQDRHHENWGAIWTDGRLRLAPTFDHGAALARNLLDQERQRRLQTKDRNQTVAAYVRRGRSALYLSQADSQPLGLCEAFQQFNKHAADAIQVWLGRLRMVNRDHIWSILDRVPSERMSDTAKQFAVELLLANQQRLLE